MSWFDRLFARRRVKPDYQPDIRFVQFGNVTTSVNVYRPEEVMKVAAVWRCVNLLANSIATLDWKVHRVAEDGTRHTRVDHDIYRLLNTEPNPEMTPFSFRQVMMQHKLLYGNFYAEIESDAMGRAKALWPIAPDRVEPWRSPEGRLFFRINQPRGGTAELHPMEVFHVPGMSWDGIRGYSVLEVAAQSLSGAMAMDKFSGSFFGNGLMPSGIVEIPQDITITPEGMQRMQDEFVRKHRGTQNAGKPLILDQGMKWTQLSMDADKGQLLDTRKFTVYDVCRWFGVPPYLAFASEEEPRANVETQSREFVQYGLDPHVTALEQEADRKLFFGYRPMLKTKMNTDEFLLADIKARAEFYTSMRHIGVYTVNDVLRAEGKDPIGPEGDVRVMQVQFQPVGTDGAPQPINDGEPTFSTTRNNDNSDGETLQ